MTNPDGSARLPRNLLLIFASLGVVLGFAWLLRAGTLPVVPPAEALARVPVWVPVAYGGVWIAVLFLRAMRWYWLLAPLHPIQMRRVLTISFIGYGALLLLPFRMGELVRPALVHDKGKISGWAATGTIGAERVIDGFFLSALLFISLRIAKPMDPLPEKIGGLDIPASIVPTAAYSALCLFSAVFIVMGAFYFRREWSRRMTERLVGLVSPRLASWLAARVERVADGLSFLPRAQYMRPFLTITVIYWAVNAAGIWLLCQGVGFHSIGYFQACVLMGVLGLGVLVPNAPGFFGSFQISVYAGLAMYTTPEEVINKGSVAVFWLYVLQIGVTFVLSGVALLMERISPAEALATADGKSLSDSANPG